MYTEIPDDQVKGTKIEKTFIHSDQPAYKTGVASATPKSRQVKILITNPIMHFALCKVQQYSKKQELFVVMVQLKLFRVFKPAGLTVCIFSLSLFLSFANLEFLVTFCTYEGKVPYRSSPQISYRWEVGICFVALDILESQIARHRLRSAAISRHLAKSVGRSLLRSSSFTVRHKFICGHPRGQGLSTQQVKIFLGLGLMASGRRVGCYFEILGRPQARSLRAVWCELAVGLPKGTRMCGVVSGNEKSFF
jgi:hypothetical protein